MLGNKLSFAMMCVVGFTASYVSKAAAAEEYPYNGSQKPSIAQAGECWCTVIIPAQYKTVTDRVMVERATCHKEAIPAEFETRSERVCVKPEARRSIPIAAEYRTDTYQALVRNETCRRESVPAEYENREERVCVRPANTERVRIPALYRDESYQALLAPARTEWRKTECQAINTSNGEKKDECFCLVTIPAQYETRTRQVCAQPETCSVNVIPAEYKTITKRVCVKPESFVSIPVPAVYETRTRQVCVRPASSTCEIIPAEYKTVERQVCVKPESERRVEIPAKYEDRAREICTAPERRVWRRTDCRAEAPRQADADVESTKSSAVSKN